MNILLLLGALTFLSAPALASTQMSLEKRQAVALHDDAQTSVQALTKAAADAGFAAEVVK